MRRSRSLSALRFAALAVLAVFALVGCAKETAPNRLHSITGHVRVIGYLTAEDSHFLGTRVVDDATGVRVDLLLGTRVVATTTTVNGTYRFENLEPGGYAARATAMGLVAPVTNTLTIATVDVVARDTLTMASQGDLYPAPNPIVDQTLIGYELANNVPVSLEIRDATGALVQTLVTPTADLGAGFHVAIWDGCGSDPDHTRVPAGLYWAYFVASGDVRCQAIFRDSLPAPGARRARPLVRWAARTPFASLAR